MLQMAAVDQRHQFKLLLGDRLGLLSKVVFSQLNQAAA
jgi:hypothetical protein